MIAAELLDAARHVLDHPQRSTHGSWGRAAATLARQALEAHIRDLLGAQAPGARSTPMRTQLLCLSSLAADRDRAHALAYAWHRLSEATHHHAYELPPTAEELQTWLAIIADALAAASAPARSSTATLRSPRDG